MFGSTVCVIRVGLVLSFNNQTSGAFLHCVCYIVYCRLWQSCVFHKSKKTFGLLMNIHFWFQ